MSKSNTFHIRKRYFFCVSLFVMLTCLLYLYTTDYKIVEPLVKAASITFKSPKDKILNLFTDTSTGTIANLNEVESRRHETRNMTSRKLNEGVSNVLDSEDNSKSNTSLAVDITPSSTENPKPVSITASYITNLTVTHTNILKQNSSTDTSTPKPATTTTLIYTEQRVNHTNILTQNSSSSAFHFFEENSSSAFHPTSTNIAHLKPTTASSHPVNKSFIQSAVPSKQSPSNKVVDCGQLWVTSHENGRLGNIMCEYAHLMVLHLEYGVQVGLLPKMHNSLSPFFPKLSIKRLPLECLQVKNIATYDWSVLDSLLRDKKLKNPSAAGGYPCNPNRLWKYRDLWRKEFNFSTSIKQGANSSLVQSLNLYKLRLLANEKKLQKMSNASLLQENTEILQQMVSTNTTLENVKVIQPKNVSNGAILLEVKKNASLERFAFTDLNSIANPLVIGVHVRRTDYIPYFMRTTGDNIVGPQYFRKAFQFFREKYNNVMFLVASDDRQWCQSVLEKPNTDVIVAPSGSPQQDMALLATSSHLIMSLGTYGFWSAVLSRGTVAYPRKVGKKMEYGLTKALNTLNSTELVSIT